MKTPVELFPKVRIEARFGGQNSGIWDLVLEERPGERVGLVGASIDCCGKESDERQK